MSETGPTPGDWERREALLDRLLELENDAARSALLAEIERDNAEDAHALRRWLQAIETVDESWIPADTPPDLQHEGEDLGNWRTLHLLGRGGMGEVWLGERADGLFDKQVAIKFIRDDRPALRAAIESERRLLANLRHPGIVSLLDAGATAKGTPYLVTDFIDGVRLDAWLGRTSPDLAGRIALFNQVARAVAHAHEQLIVHGDIKPANILVTADGRTHLLDFGISRAVNAEPADARQSPDTVLTPEYAAPELALGTPPSTRSDIHALGGLLHFFLHERPPRDLQGLSMPETLAALRSGQAAAAEHSSPAVEAVRTAPAHLRKDMAAIVRKALAHEPEQRYGTVDALVNDIHAARDNLPVQAHPASRRDRAWRALRRHRNAAMASALILIMLLAGLAGIAWQAQVAAHQRDLAEAEARNANAVRNFVVGVFAAANPEQNLGNTPSALELVDAGVRRIDNELKGQPALQAELYGVLGDTYAGLGQYQQALALQEKALSTATRAVGADAQLTRELLVRYARTQLLQGGPYDDLRARLQQTLARPAGRSVDAQVTVAQMQAYYAGLLHRMGELKPAGNVLAEAIARARALGPDGQEALAIALHQQAQLEQSQGHRDRAIHALRELDGLLAQTPQRSVGDRQLIQQELASLLGEAGKGDDAEALLREVVEANEQIYGPKHPLTISSKVDQGRALARHGKTESARRLLTAMVDLAEQEYGPNAEATAFALTNLAAIEYADGRYDATIALLERTLRSVASRDGPQGPRTLLMLQNLARVRIDAGDLSGAQRELEQILSLMRSAGSGATAEPLALLGDIARQQGDPRRARSLHQRALDVYAAAGDTSSFDVQDHRLALALDERDLGNMPAARQYAQAGLDGLSKLDQAANSDMIDYARYVLAQLDVLEGQCNTNTRKQLDAFARHHRDEMGTSAINGPAAWRYARIELYLGLCGMQVDTHDAASMQLTEDAARKILEAPEADPHSRRLARDTLRKLKN